VHNTKKFPVYFVNSSISCSLFQKLLVFPKNDPEGVYHARNPEEKGEDDVDEEPGATAVDEEDGDRRAKESAEQTDQAGRITVLAAALSFTHFDELLELYFLGWRFQGIRYTGYCFCDLLQSDPLTTEVKNFCLSWAGATQ